MSLPTTMTAAVGTTKPGAGGKVRVARQSLHSGDADAVAAAPFAVPGCTRLTSRAAGRITPPSRPFRSAHDACARSSHMLHGAVRTSVSLARRHDARS